MLRGKYWRNPVARREKRAHSIRAANDVDPVWDWGEAGALYAARTLRKPGPVSLIVVNTRPVTNADRDAIWEIFHPRYHRGKSSRSRHHLRLLRSRQQKLEL